MKGKAAKLTVGESKAAGLNELPEGWTETTLDVVSESKLGKMLDKAKNAGIPTPYLRNINVRWFDFDLDGLLTIKILDCERDKFSIRDGDVLVCEGGEPGRAAVWRRGDTNVVFQKAIHRVRLADGILPEWLVYRLKFDAASPRLEKYFTGSTIKHLTGKLLKRYSFPVAPLAEQRRIVAKVEGLLERVRKVRERLESAAAILGLEVHATSNSRLEQTILAKAFRGELVETEADLADREGRDYEPASVLLERIATKRAAAGNGKPKGKKAKKVAKK